MIKVTLKDGSVKEYAQGTTALEAAKAISEGLARVACAVKIDGIVADLRTPLTEDCKLEILTFEQEDGKKTFWHSAAHLMAQAVLELYPDVKLAMGPAVSGGFYYDFKVETPFTPDDLQKIEERMKKIVKENVPIERKNLSDSELDELFADEPLKQELINEYRAEGRTLTVYTQGVFADLCTGPHLMSTSAIKAFKLTQCTGAYWRGDASRDVLCRVYGVAFPKPAELKAHLEAMEEAKKRDHNKLGRELKFFTTVDYIGQGLPILLPKGAKVIQIMQRFVEDEEERRGYQLTKTPFMAKSDMYKISGHWDHYKDGMFIIGDDEDDKDTLALRPMTCPFHFQVFLNETRSYRDLPQRYNETSSLFRNESSGEMHGLIRVRQFTISEGHIACTPDQVKAEFSGCVELARYLLDILGFTDDISFQFSCWDPKDKESYIGSAEQWEDVQSQMRDIMDELGIDYTVAEGEAAFYGPKLDIQMKNVFGKEDTIITVQIDFQLAERFGMEYVDVDGQKKHPYILHRTSIGCYERTLAMLIEKYAGALPLWLSPSQVMVIPITDRQKDYAERINKELLGMGVRSSVDSRNEKVGFKIREAQLDKVPYMVVLGDREEAEATLAVRTRKDGETATMSAEEFYKKLRFEIDTKAK